MEELNRDRIYYVRTDGNDDNSGLADNAADAFKTIQKAIDSVYGLLINGYSARVQIGPGQFDENVIVAGPLQGAVVGAIPPASLRFIIQGSPGTVVNGGSGMAMTFSDGCDCFLKGIKVIGFRGIWSTRHARLWWNNIEFGACDHIQLWTTDYGISALLADASSQRPTYKVSAGAGSTESPGYHVWTDTMGTTFLFDGDVTFQNSPAFSGAVFAARQNGGCIESSGMNFFGAVYGKRYLADGRGMITTGTNGRLDYFPGDAPGLVADGGSYDLIPKFLATKNDADQTSIPNGKDTKVIFGTAVSNKGGYYDAANSRWMPAGGPVRVAAQIFITGGNAGGKLTVCIYKNGTAIRAKVSYADSCGNACAEVIYYDDASGTDYYEIYVNVSTSLAATINGSTNLTFFEGTTLAS